MTGRLLFVRLSYWLCIVFELMAVVPMLFPPLFGKAMAISGFHPGADYRYAMEIAAVFTLGWIALLLWAGRKPVERRGVMLLTIFPVFIGNMLCGIYAATSGFIGVAMMVPSWIVQAVIIVLFGFSYHFASLMDTSPQDADSAGERARWRSTG